MNKRFKELAEKSGIDFFTSIDHDPEFFGRQYCEAWIEQQQYFAESIVRECTSQIAMLGITHFDNEDISWATSKLIEIINERFGVNQ